MIGSSWDNYDSSITFSSDCKLAAVGRLTGKGRASPLQGLVPIQYDPYPSDYPFLMRAGALRLWDVESAQELAAFEDCKEAKFSPDNKTLATLHFDHTIHFWSLPIRKPLGRILMAAALIWLFPAAILCLGVILIRKWKRV